MACFIVHDPLEMSCKVTNFVGKTKEMKPKKIAFLSLLKNNW